MMSEDVEFEWRMSRGQVICDDCGALQLKGLAFRCDLESPVRLCRSCVKKHDSNPDVQRNRDHNYAMDSEPIQ